MLGRANAVMIRLVILQNAMYSCYSSNLCSALTSRQERYGSSNIRYLSI